MGTTREGTGQGQDNMDHQGGNWSGPRQHGPPGRELVRAKTTWTTREGTGQWVGPRQWGPPARELVSG